MIYIVPMHCKLTSSTLTHSPQICCWKSQSDCRSASSCLLQLRNRHMPVLLAGRQWVSRLMPHGWGWTQKHHYPQQCLKMRIGQSKVSPLWKEERCRHGHTSRLAVWEVPRRSHWHCTFINDDVFIDLLYLIIFVSWFLMSWQEYLQISQQRSKVSSLNLYHNR